MKLTPLERRFRIYELSEADEEYRKMMIEYTSGKAWFEKHVGRLPRKLAGKLWAYPAMGYFLHHRMLNLICENMKFSDED